MQRTIRTFLPMTGDVTALTRAFTGDPMRWLPDARRDGPDRYLLPVQGGAWTRTVSAEIGQPWRAGATRWRSIAWDPTPEQADPVPLDRLLPALDGEIGLHLQPTGRGATLLVDTRYIPPGGPLGAAVDAVALHRVARGTLEALLASIATRLQDAAGAATPAVVGGTGAPSTSTSSL